MSVNMHKRILLTGGGTGGHIYPLIAIARKLKNEAELKYFGPKNIFSFYLLGEGIAIKHITSSKIRRYFSFLNFLDGFRFIWSIFQALFKVYFYMPDVCFSKGGPGSAPVILACRFYKIPIVIHESDSIPGKANLIASRYAKIIELGFESAAEHFKNYRGETSIIKVTGNPVREDILRFVDPAEARRGFGLDVLKPTILILGGSQGATRINDFIYKNLDALIAKYQIIHGVGNENYLEYMHRFEKLPKGYFVAAYFENNLPEAYSAADLVISRAGATTIFELAALGKPVILVPLPESASDHQKENAYQYAKTGAAIVIEQENLLINLLESQLHQLLDSPEKLKFMSEAAKGFYKPEAAEMIAKDILSCAL